jgi:hypothetical protein
MQGLKRDIGNNIPSYPILGMDLNSFSFATQKRRLQQHYQSSTEIFLLLKSGIELSAPLSSLTR